MDTLNAGGDAGEDDLLLHLGLTALFIDHGPGRVDPARIEVRQGRARPRPAGVNQARLAGVAIAGHPAFQCPRPDAELLGLRDLPFSQ